MHHQVRAEDHGPYGEGMAGTIQACVHCGFCLAACPTYGALGQEMDSPRGRIILMKEVLEGTLPLEAAGSHIDRCLGCLACEPACPSGVVYRDLINPFRALTESRRRRNGFERLRKWGLSQTLPYPKRFFRAVQLGRLAKLFRGLFPRSVRQTLDLVPDQPPKPPETFPAKVSAAAAPRARVALLLGCAQQVLAPEINAATIRLLTSQGVEVLIPEGQSCCGALDWHTGNLKQAQRHAWKNLRAFPERLDAIVTNAAGCGSGLQEYPHMLRDQADPDALQAFAGKVMDVTAFLDQLGVTPPKPLPAPLKIAYHDACHLSHGQGVRSQPRALLQAIPNVELVEIADPHLCCGSAGSYNLDQPEIAIQLGREKAQRVLATGSDCLVTGNIGCLTQLRLHLDLLGSGLPVKHTVEILAEAYS